MKKNLEKTIELALELAEMRQQRTELQTALDVLGNDIEETERKLTALLSDKTTEPLFKRPPTLRDRILNVMSVGQRIRACDVAKLVNEQGQRVNIKLMHMLDYGDVIRVDRGVYVKI